MVYGSTCIFKLLTLVHQGMYEIVNFHQLTVINICHCELADQLDSVYTRFYTKKVGQYYKCSI